MVDELPVMEQCMADVKNGIYQTSDAAVVAAGGMPDLTIDPATDQPVQILVSSTDDLVDENTTLQLRSTDTDQVIEVTAPDNFTMEQGLQSVPDAFDSLSNDASLMHGKALDAATSLKEKAKQGIADAESAVNEASLNIIDQATDAATDFEAAIKEEQASVEDDSDEAHDES